MRMIVTAVAAALVLAAVVARGQATRDSGVPSFVRTGECYSIGTTSGLGSIRVDAIDGGWIRSGETTVPLDRVIPPGTWVNLEQTWMLKAYPPGAPCGPS